MEKKERILENLLKPEAEFSPIPFWFFNDAFDEERVRTQLEDYKAKGVDGFVLHPRIGVPRELPYLSDAYFQAVRFIVETAAELEMKVVLYDEGMYPSGSAHGMVVESRPMHPGVLFYWRKKPQLTDYRESRGRKPLCGCLMDGRFCTVLREEPSGGSISEKTTGSRARRRLRIF